jgi:RNA polymerase sigma-70 factor, ECF subfamily
VERLAFTTPDATAGGNFLSVLIDSAALGSRYSRAKMSRLDPQSLPQHVDRLYRAAWALCGSPHDAEDLVQETFSRVLARPRFIRGQDELGYLMQALRNTFLSQRRTAARRPRTGKATLEDVEPVDHRTGARPEEALQAREVLGAISALSENHRLALVAVDVVGLSYREAAAALGTREATIATRVFRAREQLAKDLDPGRGAPAVRASARRSQHRGKLADRGGVLASETTND